MKQVLAALCAACLLSLPVRAQPLSVDAKSCLLMEKETGEVLYAENEHTPLEPASVTKVMTLLLVMEAIDSGTLRYEDMVSVSACAASMGGSQVYLKENEQMSVEDLLKAVCVASGNDAAVALAEHIAGSAENFVARMNQRAAEIGMEDTTFLNCTGLPAQGHVTSAYDIALMSRELILRHPDIRRFTTIWMDSLRDGAFTLNNTNKLVRFYEGTTGLKTGSTDAAGYCISATAEREGMELIAVVMGSPTGPQRFESAKVLLSYGFSLYTLIRITPEQVLPAVPVTLGTADYVQPVLGAGDALLLEKSQTADLRQEVRLAETLQAPVEAGQEIGELIVHSQGQETARIPIVAGEAVERLQYGQILVRCLKIAFMVDGFRQVG